ncbi:hypothetical protein [Nostoc sp. C110]|uniref:hypothetical protein n=1 Tax=Nostoc sp. C110 TaxID=3349876 RepID=UPI00370D0672
MNLKEFASQNNVTIAKVRELCNILFESVPDVLNDDQLYQLVDALTLPSEPEKSKLITGFKSESLSLRKHPQHTTAIALGEDYQKLYQLIPAQFQAQLDKLPERDRISVLLAACDGIELAELQHLTKEAFESARLTQLQNQSNSAKLQQSKERATKRDDYSDFDTAAFIQQLEAQEILAALLK